MKKFKYKDAVNYFAEQYTNPEIREKVFKYKSSKLFIWNRENPYVSAGYIFPTNVLSQYGSALTRPFGRVHWAGAERSPHGVNWIEGAVTSGNRAAREIIEKNMPKKTIAKKMNIVDNSWWPSLFSSIFSYIVFQ